MDQAKNIKNVMGNKDIKGIVFDLGGVLIGDSRRAMREYVSKALPISFAKLLLLTKKEIPKLRQMVLEVRKKYRTKV